MTKHIGKRSENRSGPRDRRSKERIPFSRPVRLQRAFVPGVIEATTANLSEDGMFIQPARIPVGASVDFSIALGDGLSPIQGRGEVIRLRIDENGAPSVGIRFLYLSTKNSKLVRRIVAEHLREGTVASHIDAEDSGEYMEVPVR